MRIMIREDLSKFHIDMHVVFFSVVDAENFEKNYLEQMKEIGMSEPTIIKREGQNIFLRFERDQNNLVQWLELRRQLENFASKLKGLS